MPLALQVKLLRALQEQEVRPVGSSESFPFEARIIAATNKDLEKEVGRGNFREDLFYRLNVIEINIPPLRDRSDDIPLLVRHFLGRAAADQELSAKKISDEAMTALVSYRWPGNVRELQNAVERAYILSDETIGIDHLTNRIKKEGQPGYQSNDPEGFRPSLVEVERRYIIETLNAVNNDKAAAARILGIDLSTLYRKLKKYNEL